MDVDEFHNIDENKTIEFLKNQTYRANNRTTIKNKKNISYYCSSYVGRTAKFSKLYD